MIYLQTSLRALCIFAANARAELPPSSQTPANLPHTDGNIANHAGDITQPSEDDDAPVASSSSVNQRARDRNTGQSRERHHRIASGIVPPVLARIAQLPNASRHKTDVAAARKAKKHRVYHNQWYNSVIRRRQPEGERRYQTQHQRQDHNVEPPHAVGRQAR